MTGSQSSHGISFAGLRYYALEIRIAPCPTNLTKSRNPRFSELPTAGPTPWAPSCGWGRYALAVRFLLRCVPCPSVALTPFAPSRSMELNDLLFQNKSGVPLRRKKRHILALLILVNYLLALTAGSSLHNHHGRHCDEVAVGCASSDRGHVHACGQAEGCRDGSSCHGDTASPRWDSCRAGWRGAHHDRCPVCEFLAQKPIPASQIAETFATPLRDTLARSTPPRRGVGVASSYQVRAPPAVA